MPVSDIARPSAAIAKLQDVHEFAQLFAFPHAGTLCERYVEGVVR